MLSARIHPIVSIFFLVVLTRGLAAQDSATGSIRGSVLDSAGGRIAHASIVVVNVGTGGRYAMSSDAEGGFAFEQLPPGD